MYIYAVHRVYHFSVGTFRVHMSSLDGDDSRRSSSPKPSCDSGSDFVGADGAGESPLKRGEQMLQSHWPIPAPHAAVRVLLMPAVGP